MNAVVIGAAKPGYAEAITRKLIKNGFKVIGIQIAREIIAKTTDFVDGYYFSFPFNRVHMLKKIIGKNNQ